MKKIGSIIKVLKVIGVLAIALSALWPICYLHAQQTTCHCGNSPLVMTGDFDADFLQSDPDYLTTEISRYPYEYNALTDTWIFTGNPPSPTAQPKPCLVDLAKMRFSYFERPDDNPWLQIPDPDDVFKGWPANEKPPISKSFLLNSNCVAPSGFSPFRAAYYYCCDNDTLYVGADISNYSYQGPYPLISPPIGGPSVAWDTDGDGNPNGPASNPLIQQQFLSQFCEEPVPQAPFTEKYVLYLDFDGDMTTVNGGGNFTFNTLKADLTVTLEDRGDPVNTADVDGPRGPKTIRRLIFPPTPGVTVKTYHNDHTTIPPSLKPDIEYEITGISKIKSTKDPNSFVNPCKIDKVQLWFDTDCDDTGERRWTLPGRDFTVDCKIKIDCCKQAQTIIKDGQNWIKPNENQWPDPLNCPENSVLNIPDEVLCNQSADGKNVGIRYWARNNPNSTCDAEITIYDIYDATNCNYPNRVCEAYKKSASGNWVKLNETVTWTNKTLPVPDPCRGPNPQISYRCTIPEAGSQAPAYTFKDPVKPGEEVAIICWMLYSKNGTDAAGKPWCGHPDCTDIMTAAGFPKGCCINLTCDSENCCNKTLTLKFPPSISCSKDGMVRLANGNWPTNWDTDGTIEVPDYALCDDFIANNRPNVKIRYCAKNEGANPTDITINDTPLQGCEFAGIRTCIAKQQGKPDVPVTSFPYTFTDVPGGQQVCIECEIVFDKTWCGHSDCEDTMTASSPGGSCCGTCTDKLIIKYPPKVQCNAAVVPSSISILPNSATFTFTVTNISGSTQDLDIIIPDANWGPLLPYKTCNPVGVGGVYSFPAVPNGESRSVVCTVNIPSGFPDGTYCVPMKAQIKNQPCCGVTCIACLTIQTGPCIRLPQATCGRSRDDVNVRDYREFFGYNGRMYDPITASPYVFKIVPGTNWQNFVAAQHRNGIRPNGSIVPAPVPYVLTNVTLEKVTGSSVKCKDDFPVIRVIQEGTQNIRTWWPLMYEPPYTTFTLTVCWKTNEPLNFPSDPPNTFTTDHCEKWIWCVGATVRDLKNLVALFHQLPAETCEVPLIADEALYCVLQKKLDEVKAALIANEFGQARLRMLEFEMLVANACMEPCPPKPFPRNDARGVLNAGWIIDSECNPACCKLLADAEYIINEYIDKGKKPEDLQNPECCTPDQVNQYFPSPKQCCGEYPPLPMP